MTNQHAEWSPLLEGELRERALETVQAVVSALLDADQEGARAPGPSLASGRSGFALLLAEAARLETPLATSDAAEAMLARAVEELAAAPRGVDLFDGYPGIALAVELLRENGYAVPSGSAEIDRAVAHIARRFDELSPLEAHLDLVIGLVGMGLYLGSRLPRRTARAGLEQVVRRLDERAIESEHGVTWRSPPREPKPYVSYPGRICDLGLAHGVPGHLVFLTKARSLGILPEISERLLSRGARWLLAQRKNRTGALFDAYVPTTGEPLRNNELPPSPARNAWCYGDPGVAIALLTAARSLGDASLETEALRVAEHASSVRDDPSMVDACLCHGSAGLLHIFNRLHCATGRSAFRVAALHWAERTLQMRHPGQGFAGYSFDLGPGQSPRIQGDAGLLNGAAGVALALTSAVSTRAPLWDRVLLLDVPMQREAHAERKKG